MKISTRLALYFSLIASSIYVTFGVAVYLSSSNHRSNEFQKRLEERLLITEKIFLEKESFSPEEFEKINTQFLNTLPDETEEVIEISSDKKLVFKYNYSPDVKSELLKNESYYFETFDVQGLSKVFNVKGRGYLIIVTAVDQLGLQNLSFLRVRIIILILIGIPLILIGSFILSKKALSPLSRKIQHANAISASNLHQRLKVFNPDDEIGELAIAFNKLLDRLELAFDAHKSFISNASHEIRNPLTAIMGEAEIAVSKSRTPEEYMESLNSILSEAEMLSSTVNNLLQLSKVTANEEGVRFEPIEFESFLKEVKTSFDFVNPTNQIHIMVDTGTSKCTILGNKNLLKAALFNLFDNACKFSENQKVVVSLSQQNQHLKLSIIDNGQGVSEDDLMKIKNPFFRGKNAIQIKGSGIGLSLTDKIISLHKGGLKIQSTLEVGTSVEVVFPLNS